MQIKYNHIYLPFLYSVTLIFPQYISFQTSYLLFFGQVLFLFMCMWVFMEAKRKCWVPWIWSCRWFWTTRCDCWVISAFSALFSFIAENSTVRGGPGESLHMLRFGLAGSLPGLVKKTVVPVSSWVLLTMPGLEENTSQYSFSSPASSVLSSSSSEIFAEIWRNVCFVGVGAVDKDASLKTEHPISYSHHFHLA